MKRTRHLSPGQLRALRKVGDVLIPGDGNFPSFSRSGVAVHVDRMLDYVHASDRAGIKTLLGLFLFLPKTVIRLLLRITEHHRRFPGPVAAVLRLINTGIKGVVMTLYYSDIGEGPSIHQLIGYDARVVELPKASSGGDA
jgi:hypothetical protein